LDEEETLVKRGASIFEGALGTTFPLLCREWEVAESQERMDEENFYVLLQQHIHFEDVKPIRDLMILMLQSKYKLGLLHVILCSRCIRR
jgi:hypothetical protein